MADIEQWDPEEKQFWNNQGKKIANRNLWISIPCLLFAYAIWLFWSVIVVEMKDLSFPFDNAQLFTLPAIAGLMGATLRIPNAFLIALAGGRNTIFLTTLLLLFPAVGVGIALQNLMTPYIIFVILAALSGIGGGAFASSMSNISYFFPRKVQGTSLGLNAGLGNLGVSVMQLLLPFVVTFALFGSWGGVGQPVKETNQLIYIQNCGLVWIPILLLFSFLSWFGMHNLKTASPYLASIRSAFGKILTLLATGFVSGAIGLHLLLVLGGSKWIVLPTTIVLTVFLMTLVPGAIKRSLTEQFVIFRNKHNWVMTYLYTMTFGSFIGFSAVFPLLIRVVFGELPDGTRNPNGPDPFAYAWLGPLVGSLMRPVGGWLSDKFGGSKVTHWDTIAMIIATLSVAYWVKFAMASQTPEEYFFPFLFAFLVLFITTGIGNGSTFRMIPHIFEVKEAGPVLGWASSVAAYGAFLIPQIFGEQINSGHLEQALYGFALYYSSCLVVNWYYYGRKNAEVYC